MKRLLNWAMTEAEREIVVPVYGVLGGLLLACVLPVCALCMKPVVAPVAYEWVWEIDKDNWGEWRKRKIE